MNFRTQLTTCLGLVACLALSACNQTASAAEKKPPIPVKVGVVEPRATGVAAIQSELNGREARLQQPGEGGTPAGAVPASESGSTPAVTAASNDKQ